MILRRRAIASLLLALIAANLAMIFIAVAQYRELFSQPGAQFIVWGPAAVLVVYAAVFLWIGSTRRFEWDMIVKSAALYGLLGGALDVLNILAENGIPIAVHIAALTIAVMLTLFGSWAVAGFRIARALGSVRAGLFAALVSAGVCMLIAVAAGFAIQFFIHPLDPAYVSKWAEFKRSGWTDARAFGLANTLDSAFTHLIIAPIVALVVGGCASLLSQVRSGKRDLTAWP